ncbi:MAG: mtgA [Deltaproteobacteria bacterium]|nr:mtgA [Deltaproteobacteria bacterium]
MRDHGRFVALAATALVIYALVAWLFWLPAIRVPGPGAVVSVPDCTKAAAGEPLVVPLADVPSHLIETLLQQEDGFYHHHGVDWNQLVRALGRNLWERRWRYGASTLTMQMVRELFLTKERSILRKLREIAYALQAEQRLSKDEILELYLNVVEWGPRIHGVGAASCYYFGVPPGALTPEESARLVAVLPSPPRFGPALRAESGGQRIGGPRPAPATDAQ